MGTASTKKIIKLGTNFQLTQEAALTTSAGVSDADRIPALNAAGVLDASIVNSKTTSAGVSDSGKLVALNAAGVLDASIVNSKTTSAGAGDSGKIPALDGTGRLDSTFMPVGIGADTASITASENLAAGDFINIHNSTGAKVRKADATAEGKEAHGFVLSAVTSGNPATVYFEGTNTGVTGQTPGIVYLSTTAGQSVSSVSSYVGGNVVQSIGFAVSATAINFQSGTLIVLA